MNNLENNEDGDSIKIFGHGTLFGDKLPHPSYAEPPVSEDQVYTYHTIDIQVILAAYYPEDNTATNFMVDFPHV